MAGLAIAVAGVGELFRYLAACEEKELVVLRLALEPQVDPEIKAQALAMLTRENAQAEAKDARRERFLKLFGGDKPEGT